THYMDEAVRCHRLCVFRSGRRVALASPGELTSALEDRVVELWGEPTGEAIKLLRGRPEVASLTQMGDRVHTLLVPGAPAAADALGPLVEFLTGHGLEDPGGEVAEPNLEDALVALSQGEELE
ncbi:MAG: ABC transporter ATP-binding protein, partial [Acidobacteria bacterium]|nr:ABC transporter ATP-binding protein [Acidobacteriota bacterium]